MIVGVFFLPFMTFLCKRAAMINITFKTIYKLNYLVMNIRNFMTNEDKKVKVTL